MSSQAAAIRLIIGLGNPGPKYETTRHNAGFWLADNIANDLGASFNQDKTFFADVAKARYDNQAIIIAKPNTFMNRSGQSVGALMRFYKLQPEQILVLHDELDLMPGQAKLKLGGGHAGHNGLRDIQSKISSPKFWRLRIGIGHPRDFGLEQPVASFVLNQPQKSEFNQIDDVIYRCRQITTRLLDAQFDSAIEQLHTGNS